MTISVSTAAPTIAAVASAQVDQLATSATVQATFHPSLGMPEETLVYSPSPLNGVSISRGLSPPPPSPLLRVTIPPASVPLIFAHRQWRAGLLLADLLAHQAQRKDRFDTLNVPTTPLDVSGARVLELGCGTGIPGMVACKLGHAEQTLLTDYDSSSLTTTLRTNLVSNFSTDDVKTRIRSMGYTWGTSTADVEDTMEMMHFERRRRRGAQVVPTPAPTSSSTSSFNRILLADCMWDSLSHADLVKSLTQLLDRRDPNAFVLVVSGLHTGRDKITSFIRRAHRAGLVLADIDPRRDTLPVLDTPQKDVQQAQTNMGVSPGDPCWNAAEYVYEVELNTDAAEEVVVAVPTGDGRARADIDAGKDTPRLTGRRRIFVLDERPEERKEMGGVHVRNRWITIWALKWAVGVGA